MLTSVLTRPDLTGPVLTGPDLTGPVLTGPVLTGPVLTSPMLTGPLSTNPDRLNPAVADLVRASSNVAKRRSCMVPGVTETTNVEFASLVQRAIAHDNDAWTTLVARLSGVVWKTVMSSSLSPEDRKDVFAATFFRLYERLSTVREPEKLPGWIASVARNEILSTYRAAQRHQRDTRPELIDLRSHDEGLIDAELKTALARAFARLPEDAQRLLHLLMNDPPLGYDEIANRLGVPRGSIGPTRARLLARLRTMPELAPFMEGAIR
jgi:RNA polymerase sigma factor (sigma-70 family)